MTLTDHDLYLQLNRIHTTEQGEARIRRNLALTAEDVVAWCRDAVVHAREIERRGKNWYVYVDQAVLTINAHSFTIITAHRIKPQT